jgi:hypothetical protein
MEADSDRQDQNVQKIHKAVTISGSARSNSTFCRGQLFQKFKYENVIKRKNKPDPALFGGSYLFNEIKKRRPKSRETIPLIFKNAVGKLETTVAPSRHPFPLN